MDLRDIAQDLIIEIERMNGPAPQLREQLAHTGEMEFSDLLAQLLDEYEACGGDMGAEIATETLHSLGVL